MPVDVILAWSDHCPTAELKSLVATRAHKRRQLQEMEQGEVEAISSSNSLQVTEDLEAEVEGVDDPLLTRGLVSEYPDLQEQGNSPVGSSGLHPPKTLSKDPCAHTLAAL